MKLRTWDKKNKRWINLYELKFSKSGEIIAIVDIHGSFYGLHQVILIQYTGLKDKNGIEIYEGDIVKLRNEICRIVWLDECACFALIANGETKPYTLYEQFSSSKPEVIGNIYENKDLLK